MRGGINKRKPRKRGNKSSIRGINPNKFGGYCPWESVKRFDTGGPSHYNPVLKRQVPTPHVHTR